MADDLGLIPLNQKPADDLGIIPLQGNAPAAQAEESPWYKKSPIDAIKSGASYLGDKVERYADAPMRAGIYAAQKGENPITAASTQFGQPANLAPTGEDIFKEGTRDLGVTNPTIQKIGGVAMDVAASPLNFIDAPIKAAGIITKGAEASNLGKGYEAAKSLLGSGAAKIGEAISGIPAEQIKTYSKNLNEINDKIKAYGPDLAGAADDVKNNILSKVMDTKKALGEKINSALSSPNAPYVDMKPVIASLEGSKANLNPRLRAEEIKQIDGLINKVHGITTPDGLTSAKTAHDVKELLQENSKYIQNGQIFAGGEKYQQAAKNAARIARQGVNNAVPEVAEANNTLSSLHDVEDTMNSGLLKEGGSENALISAGGGNQTNRNTKSLERLGEITGNDFVTDAKKLAAQKSFTSPSLLPADLTGKAMARQAVAGVVGHSLLGPLGPALSLAASPAALKAAINAGHIPIELVKSTIGKVADFNGSDLRKMRAAITSLNAGARAGYDMRRAADTTKPNRSVAGR